MRRALSSSLLGVAIGGTIGAVSGIRWITCLSACGGPGSATLAHLQALWIGLGVSAAALAALAWRVLRPVRAQWIAVAAASVAGAGCYRLLVLVGATMDTARPGSADWAAACSLLAAAVTALTRRFRLSYALVLLGAGLTSWAHGIGRIAGDSLALQAFAYAPPPSLEYFLTLGASLALIGAIAGWIRALLTGSGESSGILRGAGVGAAIAGCVGAAQFATFLVAMRSGHEPTAILTSMMVVWAALGLTATTAARAWTALGSPIVLKLAPLAVFLAVAAYAYGALLGCGQFLALSGLHPDGVYVYIHLAADGSRSRTLDQTASSIRSERAQLFLARYPSSAYRPAALLLSARSQYEEWRFADASETLEASMREYPLLDGYRDILHAFSNIAAGRPGSALSSRRSDAYFAKWRQTQGAQIAADAAARAGQVRRAYGLHSAYLDYLATARKASWSAESAEFSLSAMDSLVGTPRFGAVKIRLASPTGPVRGARIVLVHPHPDAALPSDSVQFTGAWTIPAWGGIWAATDNRGVATLPRVPYGQYDIVVGLRFSTWPADTVVSQAPAGLTVDSPEGNTGDIRLALAVRLLSPEPAASVGGSATLSWAAYPNAHHYSASVMAVGGEQRSRYAAERGATCWARGNIRATSTIIDADHFVAGAKRLLDGQSYMWIVCAYAADGRLLASSERYFEMTQRTFTVHAR